MKMKLDENLPTDLVEPLSRLGHDVDTVLQENLKGQDDATVWKAAQEEARFLVSQDLDFSDTRKYVPGTHNGIMLIRLVNPSREALLARVAEVFTREDVFTWRGCNVVVTNQKIRIRRPQKIEE